MIMTNQEKKIQEEIDKTLGLVDTWEKPAVNPFFYGKLENRMKQTPFPSAKTIPSRLPQIALATLSLLFVCNLFTLFSPSSHADQRAELTNFANQYHISVSQ